MRRRRHIPRTTRTGTLPVPCLAAALACALAAGAAPRVPASPSPAPGPAAGGSAASTADTVPDGPASAVRGRVLDQESGDGVGQAELLFRRLVDDSVVDSTATTTGGDGAFRFEHLPSGTYALVTEHLSFATRRDTFRVPVEKRLQLTLFLAAEPVELEPLEVRVRSGWLVKTGFYRRRDRGFGKFLTPAQLERRPLNNLTQALKTVPGVEYGRRCSGGRCRDALRMSLSAGRSGCRVTYYMDGDEMHGTVTPRDISVQDLAAIEVYRSISETPPEYYGRCGSVVMWSKRSDG